MKLLKTPFPGNVVMPRKNVPVAVTGRAHALETRDEVTPSTMFANNQRATSVPDPVGSPLLWWGYLPNRPTSS
jgi:hypothetical protein